MSAILFSQDCEQKIQNLEELETQLDNPTFSEDSFNGFCAQSPQSMQRTSSTGFELKDSPNDPFAAMPKQMEYNCDDSLLSNKMAALEINEGDSGHCDGGSDSGLDTATSKPATVVIAASDIHCNDNNCAATQSNTFQRALSSTSGGYASSTGGLNDANNDVTATTASSDRTAGTPTTQGFNMSGNLSLYSCGSEAVSAELSTNTTNGGASSATQSFECYSENGSESSSMLGGGTVTTTPVRRSNSVKTKMRAFEAGRSVYSTPMTRSVRERDCSSTPISAKPTSTPSNMQSSSAAASRTRPVGVKRTSSLSRHVPPTTLQRQADKQQLLNTTNKTLMPAPTSTVRSTPSTRAIKPQKPDSLPNTLSRTQSMSMQRLVQRTPSLSRARTPCTPSEDGRWPGSSRASATVMGAAKRGVSVTPDLMSLKMRSSNMMASMEVRSTNSNTNSNPYGTLPRRRKQKSVEDLTVTPDSRSSSITRDRRMTTSVMASTRRSLVSAFGASTPQSSQSRSLTQPRKVAAQTPKTRIYHETSVQTAITGDDLENMFAGRTPTARAVDAVEQHEQTTQTDIRDAELERLRDEVRQLAQREHELSTKLQREREEKLATQRELHLNTERVMNMLEMARITGRKCGRPGGSVSGISIDEDATTPTSDEGSGSGHDSLLMLESQIQMSGHELIERQHEIGQLRQLCRTMQMEMERSLAAQECLLQEKAAIEQESSELQDFLQHEKSALCDALKELETEHQTCKQQLAGREEEVKVLRDECRHLVRLNEQRRQENRMLQSKYAALENKSKEIMMQQNYSVSGASAALSGLHSRLDSLVEQLVSTYNITEHDLEDMGFQPETQQNHSNAVEVRSTHNSDEYLGRLPSNVNANGLELCTHSQKFLPQPSDGSLSPQRNQSFIAAVISAIRNATTPSSKKLLARNNGKRISIDNAGAAELQNGQGSIKMNNNYNGETQNGGGGDDSDSTEMLDSETEPCLMMDNVLEDVTMPDSHSHNMVSSCTGIISQLEIPTELVIPASGDESLHNLSQAIVNRQQMELQISNMQSVQKSTMQLNQCEHDNSDDVSCHDSVAEMPSLMEYCTAQAVVDQVIEVDCLVTKLLKVLRLIQMDNDNCIQQLIVDKNKLQENKEDMLEKLKDLQDVNIKLQDELMDATQELMLKNTDLSNTKAEMQRHRNEIDRLTQDICNLSTLCSNYKKLSPTVEFSPLQQQLLHSTYTATEVEINGKSVENDAESILNLLKMWQTEGQFKHLKIRNFLAVLMKTQDCMPAQQQQDKINNERLRVYANQLENVLSVLQACQETSLNYADIQKLRYDIEVVKANANWSSIIVDDGAAEVNCNATTKSSQASNNIEEDVNANATGDGEREVN